MKLSQWNKVPLSLNLREIHLSLAMKGFRTKKIIVITTLLDHLAYPPAACTNLYRRRWLAELFLDDIKTSMGMDVLSCKSPAMIDREIWFYAIAYNLIRSLMAQAASTRKIDPLRLSFSGAIATIRQWSTMVHTVFHNTRRYRRFMRALLYYIAHDIVPSRPSRREPRARKRRSKKYQLMTKPRNLFKELPHRGRYLYA